MSFDHRSVAGNEELIKRLFNKVFSAILSEKIFCPPETAVYLAAYACQAKYGPAQSLRDPLPPVKDLLPRSTLDNHNLSKREWEERISNWHLKLRNTPFLDAIVEYLDIAQDVELYGAPIYEVEALSQQRKWISLDAVGINIYDSKRKPPTRRYVWSDVTSFIALDNKIEIELAHEPKQIIEFFLQNSQACALLENLFKGSKELYSRRKKEDASSKYVRRSESNSSMRMRPHKLTQMELMKLEQQIIELELELPRRATDYEYAAWQVKDQLRQARGIETRLSLNVPSTEETRQLQHRVAQIRVFLEQDFFKEKDITDRLHRYRGNFAIRIGGTLTSRSDDYSSDIDSGSERNNVSAAVGKSKGRRSHHRVPAFAEDKIIEPSRKSDHVKETPLPLAPTLNNETLDSTTVLSSSSETEDHGYVEHPSLPEPPISTMPTLPEPLVPNNLRQPKPSPVDGSNRPATYNPDAYPKFPDRVMNSFGSDDQSVATPVSTRGNPGYPEARGSEEMDPPGSVTSPTVWKHILRTPEQDFPNQYAKGRVHGRVIESEDIQLAYRPPIQPKPRVAPRGTVDPQIVEPDFYADSPGTRAPGQDPKFSSIKYIQSGYTKKRIDLFEAL